MREHLLSILLLIILISGCIEQTPYVKLPYKDDVITIEEYRAYPLSIYEGGYVTLDFWLKNNADASTEVKNVKVFFFDLDVFRLNKVNEQDDLYCPLGTPGFNNGRPYCSYDKLPSLNSRNVKITFKNTGGAKEKGHIVFSVSYESIGTSTLSFYVVKKNEKFQRGKKSESHSYSPIKLKFKTTFMSYSESGGRQMVNKDFAFEDEPITLEMWFEDVGSKQGINVEKVYGEDGTKITEFTLELYGLKVYEDDLKYCEDFEKNERNGVVYLEYKDENLQNLNTDLSTSKNYHILCTLQNVEFKEPVTQVQIIAKYGFQYKFEKTETFEIKEKTSSFPTSISTTTSV